MEEGEKKRSSRDINGESVILVIWDIEYNSLPGKHKELHCDTVWRSFL